MQKKVILSFFAVFLVFLEVKAIPAPSVLREFAAKYSSNAAQGDYAWALKDLNSQETVFFSNNPQVDNGYLPIASTAKLMTAWFAWRTLGEKWQSKVTLGLEGKWIKKKQGIWQGNLVITSPGEAFIDANLLSMWVQKIKKFGIKEIKGSLIVHTGSIEYREVIDPDSEIDRPDNATVQNLSFQFNRLDLNTLSILGFDRWEQSERCTIYPLTYQWEKTLEQGQWCFHTQYPMDQSKDLPLRQPAFFVGKLMQYLAQKEGIKISDVALQNKKKFTRPLQVIDEYRGLTLRQWIRLLLEHSNNLVAELLWSNAIQKQCPTCATYQESLSFFKKWVIKEFGPHFAWEQNNGSGLGVANKVHPLAMIALLERMYEKAPDLLANSLSINGLNGNMKERLSEHPASFWAKTGSMHYVNALAGLIFKDQKTYAFVLQDYAIDRRLALTKAKEQIQVQVFQKERDTARTWANKVKNKHSEWLKEFILFAKEN